VTIDTAANRDLLTHLHFSGWSMIDGIEKLEPWHRKLYVSDIKALTTILTIGMREDIALVIADND